jgi:predicted cobalt transporter CbtA
MGAPGLGTILKAALIAGLAAGLTAALFHSIATEPVIDRAIELEEQRHAGEVAQEEPIVSREVQKGGLVVGFLVYGVTWALLMAVVFHLAQRWLPGGGSFRQRLLFALAAYWAVGLLPFLKYPANPPGVGDPETIGYRQALYLAFLGLSVLGTALAIALGRRLGQARAAGRGGWWMAPLILGVFSALLFVVMPANPDAIELPADLVASFRALSLVGLTLFWGVLGFLFANLLKTPATPRPAKA